MAFALWVALAWLFERIPGPVSVVESLTEVLPGGSAGNLAGAVGGSGAPGVLNDLSGTTAALFLVGYVVFFLGAATLLKVRRDLV